MGKPGLYIGCSGFRYPHWRHGVFYPEGLLQKDEFPYYAKQFPSVEINATFYGIPKERVWETWEKQAPPGFLYSVKMNRYVTHRKRLQKVEDTLELFVKRAFLLKDHLGPLLFQFPLSFKKNIGALSVLKNSLRKETLVVFEFRNPGWYDEETISFCRKNAWVISFSDFPGIPEKIPVTGPFLYLRFHGKADLYSSTYPQVVLKGWSLKIKDWRKRGLSVFGYFNNDALGYAPSNAKDLFSLLV